MRKGDAAAPAAFAVEAPASVESEDDEPPATPSERRPLPFVYEERDEEVAGLPRDDPPAAPPKETSGVAERDRAGELSGEPATPKLSLDLDRGDRSGMRCGGW